MGKKGREFLNEIVPDQHCSAQLRELVMSVTIAEYVQSHLRMFSFFSADPPEIQSKDLLTIEYSRGLVGWYLGQAPMSCITCAACAGVLVDLLPHPPPCSMFWSKREDPVMQT